MFRRTYLSLTCLFTLSVVPFPLGAQESPSETASGSSGEEMEESINLNEDDLSKETNKAPFEKMEDPPLALGDTGDRVRELQATLNKQLGGKVIALRHGIYVGPARGPVPGAVPKASQRLAYSKRRGLAFQMRGDWIPCKDPAGQLPVFAIDPEEGMEEGETEELKFTKFLKLPENPLKVDGIFGQHTQLGVALFQHEQFLHVTGEVDAVTLDKLEPLVPTNPLLASIASWVSSPFDVNTENYPYLVKTLASLLATLLIFLVAMVVYQVARSLANSTHFLSRWLFTPESSPWFAQFNENKVFRRAAQFAPAFFIYFAAYVVFPDSDQSADVFPYLDVYQDWHFIVSHLGLAYVSLVLMLVGFAIAKAVDSIANPDFSTDNPIGSIIRAAKRLIGVIGTLLIIASLAGKSPFLIIGGLGAFMAVFLLVFRDYLLGLVSSVQIIVHKIVRVGDWITMPKYNADGDVLQISLTLIKVQNADKTISTIPTSAVLTESFQNWTGVEQSGGRRIKRFLLIDMRHIRVCTPGMIERFSRIELIRDYLQQKESELAEYNRDHDIEASPVNSRRLTNIGTFRAYLDRYLRNHPGLSKEMTVLVRQLQPSNNGLPIEIYAFCNSTEWAKYEAVQADIFDHVLAILPEFGLQAFQDVTQSDLAEAPANSSLLRIQAGLAELEGLVESANQELGGNTRIRPASRVEKLRKRIEELDLSDNFQVVAKGRRIVLRHLAEG